MARPKKTKANPHGLTSKQTLVVEQVIEDIKAGRGLNLTRAHHKIYNAKKRRTSAVIANENMNRPYFRDALLDGLKKKQIIGVDSKVEKRLDEGLDAINDGLPDYQARLGYIKEINKISGAYAPEKKQTASLSLVKDISNTKDLEGEIKRLEQELAASE